MVASLHKVGTGSAPMSPCNLVTRLTRMSDLRFAFRQLLKNPGFTSVAVLTLALGIGANTAMFSVVNAVLLRPLPFKEPEKLITVWERNDKQGYNQNAVAPANFADWKAQ